MRFEWDENKAESNLAKHKLDFVDAAHLLISGDLYTMRSPYDNEPRMIATGIINDRYATVIYTIRGETIRIISARPARQKERRNYDEQKRKNSKLY